MVTKKTGNRVGRPRLGFERPKEGEQAPWLRPGFAEKCRAFYDKCRKQVADEAVLSRRDSFKARAKTTGAAAAIITGDPLFEESISIALGAYKLTGSKRHSRVARDLCSAVWVSEIEAIAQYAKSFQQNTGATKRTAIAEALAACASDVRPWDRKLSPGECSRSVRAFVRDIDGRPAKFDTAMRRIMEIVSAPQRHGSDVGATGRVRFVRPAVAGAIVRQPDRDMQPLRPAGDFVPDNLFWRRLLENGDVVEVP